MRIIWIVSLLLLFAHGKILEAQYKVSYGIFGTVGKSFAKMLQKDGNYTISVEGRATGFAKFLSNGRVERYMSQGVVENGLLKPLIYKKIRLSYSKKDLKIYRFDYAHNTITVHREIYKKDHLVSKSEKKLDFFAPNDILTLYFNFRKFLQKGKYRYRFYAVGGERHSGKVDVLLPQKEELRKLRKLLRMDGMYVTVILHQKIFASKKGELHIVLDSEGIAKGALLKDVIMFGDIRAKLVKKRVYE